MDIGTALKLIDLGFTTEQIRNFETPAAQEPAVTDNVVKETSTTPAEPQPEVNQIKPEPIDYKKLAEEVALYNQKNLIVQPESPKAPAPVEPPRSPQDAILSFLG